MEDCDLPSKRDSALFLVILMMAVAAMFVWVIATEALDCFAVMLLVLFSLFWLAMLYFAVINLMVRSRKVAFSEKGMMVYGIGSRSRFYQWQSFRDIGICKVHYTSRLPYEYDIVLRFSLRDERRGPRSGAFGFWTTELYELIHFRSIIRLTFTQERLELLRAVCPAEISDHRSIRRNVHDQSGH